MPEGIGSQFKGIRKKPQPDEANHVSCHVIDWISLPAAPIGQRQRRPEGYIISTIIAIYSNAGGAGH